MQIYIPFKYDNQVAMPPKLKKYSLNVIEYEKSLFKILVKSIVLLVSMSVCVILVILSFHLSKNEIENEIKTEKCRSLEKCIVSIVESIPENITYPADSILTPSTFSAWKTILVEANTSIDMGEFYFSLKNEDVTPTKMPSSWQGEEIFKEILDAGSKRNISIRIAQNQPSKLFPQDDSLVFQNEGNAKVRSLNFDRLLGAGVLHTKLMIVDDKHVYIGSANMDWQSLTQVKELGLLIYNCPCIANDIKKIFEVYWYLGEKEAKIPKKWPSNLHTSFNIANQMNLTIGDIKSSVFISSSPLPFNPTGRTNDIDSILQIIRAADKFVYIAVMDYFPRLMYTKNGTKFWPLIDNELRRAALERGVNVRLMASHWNHSRTDLARWLISLQDISGSQYPVVTIETKLFVVPAYTKEQKSLPFGRVNHNKYMVTDKTAYISTSNWSGDYFVNTAGISVSITQAQSQNSSNPSLRGQLQKIFERDWSSEYAKPTKDFLLE